MHRTISYPIPDERKPPPRLIIDPTRHFLQSTLLSSSALIAVARVATFRPHSVFLLGASLFVPVRAKCVLMPLPVRTSHSFSSSNNIQESLHLPSGELF